MGELTIEQKAKAYDEALKVAKDIRDGKATYIPNGTHVTEAIFPELKESEGERIRKELIQYLKECTILPNGQYCRNDFFVWLKKQGQTFTKKDVDDAYLKGMCDAKHELEKQGEQKPTQRKDFISIPFGAFDSELVNETITIPDGCVATIEGDKIYIKREDL